MIIRGEDWRRAQDLIYFLGCGFVICRTWMQRSRIYRAWFSSFCFYIYSLPLKMSFDYCVGEKLFTLLAWQFNFARYLKWRIILKLGFWESLVTAGFWSIIMANIQEISMMTISLTINYTLDWFMYWWVFCYKHVFYCFTDN